MNIKKLLKASWQEPSIKDIDKSHFVFNPVTHKKYSPFKLVLTITSSTVLALTIFIISFALIINHLIIPNQQKVNDSNPSISIKNNGYLENHTFTIDERQKVDEYLTFDKWFKMLTVNKEISIDEIMIFDDALSSDNKINYLIGNAEKVQYLENTQYYFTDYECVVLIKDQDIVLYRVNDAKNKLLSFHQVITTNQNV